MSLFVASLNSGSNGNCFYIGNHDEAVLIDAGISCRETERRMKRLDLSFEKVKAIFVTHEHADHINGIPTLVKKYKLPVYITRGTLQQGRLNLKAHLVKEFRANEPVSVGNLSVTAFPKFHDACDPHSFVVSHKNVKVGVFTDIGRACENVVNYFRQCHAAFLEANYDEEMLEKGNYSYFLKNRIRGGNGHLSNKQALQLFERHRPSFMSHLFLSHLSKNNNSPDLVQHLFLQSAARTEIVIASRFAETPVYHIQPGEGNAVHAASRRVPDAQVQLSLF